MKRIRNSILLFCALLLVGACIDRIHFDSGDRNKGSIVVEGVITDKPGPYTVRLFQSANVDENLLKKYPAAVREVVISDDLGNSEKLTAGEPGIYRTSENGIRGVVGRSYKLRIELLDGSVFESKPDQMQPAGEIDSLYYEFETNQPRNGPTQYGYRFFVDSKANSGYIRWKFTGIYKAFTFPEKHVVNGACTGPRYPPPCSGYTLINGYGYVHTGDCTCCVCWLSDQEEKPHLSDEEILTNGSYKKVEMGYVPFDVWHFYYKKYMVKVEQMSLSREAYEFWNVIKDQKEGLATLFQPAFGKIQTNFFSTNSDRNVIGIFYASSVREKILFITGANPSIPYPDFDTPPEDFCFLFDACNIVYDYLNASTTPPPEWE